MVKGAIEESAYSSGVGTDHFRLTGKLYLRFSGDLSQIVIGMLDTGNVRMMADFDYDIR
jgi:hypothetical protein